MHFRRTPKKLPSAKFFQKLLFHKTFHIVQNFSELQCLADDLINFLRIIMLSQCFFTLCISFDNWRGDSCMKEKTFFRYHSYRSSRKPLNVYYRIYLMLKVLHQKCNRFIMTVVDGGIIF